MHQCDLNVNINKLSKIEGHADLDIEIRNNKVKNVSLRVKENKRFYEQVIKGSPVMAAPQMVSRICGTCSIAHLTVCIEAIEKTLDITPSPQTMLMRKLSMYSLMIRDHALHLYFFALPDVLGLNSMLDAPDDKKELIHQALHVKEAGNNLSKLVAGRAVHAMFAQVGGFTNAIDESKVPDVIKELKSIRKSIVNLSEIFYNCDWELRRDINFVALTTDDFSFLDGKICSTSGACIEEANYWDHLHKVVIPYSQATGFKFEGGEYMVGALARLNLNTDSLHENTKKTMAKYIKVFPSNNIYHNNLAQAIEIMHSIDHSIEILENTKFKKEEIIKPSKLDGEGVGVIEAPRGTLYYWLGIKGGNVEYANLVIPTAQNLVNMKKDLEQVVVKICECNSNKLDSKCSEDIRKKSERIIRAYDPCMSCASHFLKINWT